MFLNAHGLCFILIALCHVFHNKFTTRNRVACKTSNFWDEAERFFFFFFNLRLKMFLRRSFT